MKLKDEIQRYSKLNGYEISHYHDVLCRCKSEKFLLFSDDTEGSAFAKCVKCKTKLDILNSLKYASDLTQNVCNCGNEALCIGIGIATYDTPEDHRWIYVGAHCDKCKLDGVYTDWNAR